MSIHFNIIYYCKSPTISHLNALNRVEKFLIYFVINNNASTSNVYFNFILILKSLSILQKSSNRIRLIWKKNLKYHYLMEKLWKIGNSSHFCGHKQENLKKLEKILQRIELVYCFFLWCVLQIVCAKTFRLFPSSFSHNLQIYMMLPYLVITICHVCVRKIVSTSLNSLYAWDHFNKIQVFASYRNTFKSTCLKSLRFCKQIISY